MALVKFTRRPQRIAFTAGPSSSGIPFFDDAESRMNRFVERMFGDTMGTLNLPESIGWTPAINIVEAGQELTVTAELPGLDAKDVDVSIENGVLTISGEKREEKQEEQKKVHLYECSYGSFERAFTIPSSVDAAKISAQFEKGVLTIHMPKLVEAQAKGRKVEIKA